MASDVFAGIEDVRNVRLAILVQRSRDANDDRADLANSAEIG